MAAASEQSPPTLSACPPYEMEYDVPPHDPPGHRSHGVLPLPFARSHRPDIHPAFAGSVSRFYSSLRPAERFDHPSFAGSGRRPYSSLRRNQRLLSSTAHRRDLRLLSSTAPRRARQFISSAGYAPLASRDADELVITVKNQLPRYRPSLMGRKFSLINIKRKNITPAPATESYALSPSTTVRELEKFLQKRHRRPMGEPDFLILQEREDGYPSALFDNNTATLSDYHVTHGDTLHLTSFHHFPLVLYDATPLEDRPMPDSITPSRADLHFIYLQPSVYYTVANLKDMIFDITGYLPEFQHLNPLTSCLHEKDNWTLQSLGFVPNEFRQIALYNAHPLPPDQPSPPSSPPKIHCSLQINFLGVTYNISVDPTVKVKHLRNDILMIQDSYELSFGSTILESDKTLADYKITHGDVINVSEL